MQRSLGVHPGSSPLQRACSGAYCTVSRCTRNIGENSGANAVLCSKAGVRSLESTFAVLRRWLPMKHPKPVSPDQFARVGLNATHLPTFAAFRLTERGVLCTNWGMAGLT